MVLWPGPVAQSIYGITDEKDWQWMLPLLTPHPWRCFTEKLQLNDPDALRKIPKSIINCRSTLQSRPEELRHRWLEGEHVTTIDAPHDLMISHPVETAKMLISVAAKNTDSPETGVVE